MRISGGWVRDKLMGLESDDIDFTIDNMTGQDLLIYIEKYIEHVGIKEFKVVKKQKEESSHLNTLTILLFGLEIDIVHFRKETYEGNSWIPKVEKGTLKDDRERWDFTVNSFYYNIHDKSIYDKAFL